MFRRNDESGLTTLEWLLIVAAVAGLAALAVVLVQNVVDDTAEEISGSSARQTAAKVAANRVTSRAHDTKVADDSEARTANFKFKGECNRLEITYVDVDDLNAIWTENASATSPTAGDVTTKTAWEAKAYGCVIG